MLCWPSAKSLNFLLEYQTFRLLSVSFTRVSHHFRLPDRRLSGALSKRANGSGSCFSRGRSPVGEDPLDAVVCGRSPFLIRRNVVVTAVCAWADGNPHKPLLCV